VAWDLALPIRADPSGCADGRRNASYVETVTIFAHPDKVGQDKARELASKLHKRGLEVFIEGIAP
jgi:hypothetical protein